MARIARLVFPMVPHHVTQRGNRRQKVFFTDDDYLQYIALMAEWCAKSGVQIWAYCLMPNHAHLIAVPEREDSLKKGIAEAHRRYSCMVNSRENWRGHLWQGRFASYPMDDKYLLRAARYIELNPVRAQLVSEPGNYKWSSAAAHLAGKNDALVSVNPILEMMPAWANFLQEDLDSVGVEALQKHEHSGRPLGSNEFILNLEKTCGLTLLPQKRGPKEGKSKLIK